ncbi:LAME_0A00254g1_1 [Lachancea meyersii CBS 8951]|uniref:LAME_0A00254g1_1 n=1 Tax=Lachancea meyersii CBS 8951 TaxID=1266667 RepID=A0A1G4IL60_9SACH|nr:LAME_0A00254g1_1 [Lachancea meyersii CBS 8951]
MHARRHAFLLAGGILVVLIFSLSKFLQTNFSLPSLTSRSKPSKHIFNPVSSISWDNYLNFTRELDFGNSTALFNSIRAALRQSASDIHPLGVSYFPAVIPRGTLMYHAGSKIPTSFEWLAMDHEFSYSFGLRLPSYGRKSLQKHRDDPGRGPGKGKIPGGKNSTHKNPDGPPRGPPRGPPGLVGSQKMLTYRATRDLNKFLYLDGASAAKTETGEMDTQELLSNVIGQKLNLSSDGEDGGMQERTFAARICEWGKPFGLDGIIRVEVGFEVVLCNFSSPAVELVSALEMVKPNEHLGLPPPTNISKENGWPLDDDGNLVEDKLTDDQMTLLDQEDLWQQVLENFYSVKGFNWLRAGAVHDSGERRIQLDYRHMVTGINRTIINPDPNNRRLLNGQITWDTQLKIVEDLEQAVSLGFDASKSTDWQIAFDEIASKFAPMLKMLSVTLNGTDTSSEDIAIKATAITLNFCLRFKQKEGIVNRYGSDKEFAVYQYVKPLKELVTNSDYLIWSASVNVARKIVDTIYNVNELLLPIVRTHVGEKGATSVEAAEAISKAQRDIDDLIENLGWIELHYRCEQACGLDEICYTPSWGPSPMGMTQPGTTNAGAGTHYDANRQRLVINSDLKCLSLNDLMGNSNRF